MSTDTLQSEVAQLREENAALVADNAYKADEILFLRQRLANLAGMVDELDEVLAKMASPISPQRQPPRPPPVAEVPRNLSASSPAFPGVKLRRETVLQGDAKKLAVAAQPSTESPPKKPAERKGLFGKHRGEGKKH